MIYDFDTDEQALADAALLVYSVYRSKSERFKISTDMWNQIARFIQSAAQGSLTVSDFLNRFSDKMKADSISSIKQGSDTLLSLINKMNSKEVIRRLVKEHVFVILVVRTRLDGEKKKVPSDFDDSIPFGGDINE